MTLRETIEQYKGTDKTLCIGSQSAYFYIRTAENWEAEAEKYTEGYRLAKSWTIDEVKLWAEMWYQEEAAAGDEKKFKDYVDFFGLGGMYDILEQWEECAYYVCAELKSYLGRQQRKHGISISYGLQMLFDYHDALCEVTDLPLSEISPAQAWPGNLREAHDAIMKAKKLQEADKFHDKFDKTARKWAALEWSDGEICAVLPKTNLDLVNEGDTLNHCVGRYGADHVAGKLIIFIRHARRPERSWFTLNINTTKDKWSEVQLHGYGNEWAHDKRLHIPKKVRDFCDKWEREVLTPVFKKVKAAEELAKKQDEKTDKKKKARKTA